ncbi:uncharacterized protein EDB91DRAFT_877914 [Suillus paluster]|uniref:uncharacterized protein n=1 Tax=Suillus paluster TaxID=48578 RepID=UPI001B8623FE|nr:uncharacterized protein EDB91DRAFT_877914 [Suillus paluster]KAG1748395.1 hypothetical protein EDB91DRAFT_877914 [Suillus paluster]
MVLDTFLSDPRFSLLSIPTVWALNLAPALLKNATIGMSIGWDNVNPRGNIGRIRDAGLAARVDRMDGAHKNAMELFPLWIAAVLAATITKVDTHTVNTAAIAFITLRALYTLVYITQKTNAQGFLRTAVWLAACTVPLHLLFQAANVAAHH